VRARVDRRLYEGAATDDDNPPPRHLILRRATNEEVVSIPRLEPRDRVLDIGYTIRAADLDDDDAIALIVDVVLDDFAGHYYRDHADRIALENLATGARRAVAYPRG
jgi:hypothetical protein